MKNKKILIVGGTGSWGIAILERLLKTGAAQIKVLARNEHNMVLLQQKFPDKRVIPVIGDIRDKVRLEHACADVDIVFHLAAMKHVPVCEQMPTEAVATNVIGTQNLIDCAISRGVEKVIYVSTDKAVAPNCTYGCTKLLGEKLILSANTQTNQTKFIVFRSGNLLGSSGSVIPLFQRQINETQHICLTDARMSRFFIPIEQAAGLLLEAVSRGAGGEVFLPNMEALRIRDIAQYLLEKNGLDKTQIEMIGIRPGETLSESMVTQEEREALYQVNGTLYALITADSHAWVANGFVQTGTYQSHSEEAVLSYEQTGGFLTAAGI